MTSQHERAVAFAALHQSGTFVVPNPWDAGTARILTAYGFPALATTSAGLAFALGRRDGANLIGQAETLANAAQIAAATHLPVSADLENGGPTIGDIAMTIRDAAASGLVGGSIEDATGRPDAPIFPLAEAVDRITAAAHTTRDLPFPFTLTARAENFLYGRPDLTDTITRLNAYAEAGADVVYAPGLPDAEAVRTVCAAVDRPVNLLATGFVLNHSVGEIAEWGCGESVWAPRWHARHWGHLSGAHASWRSRAPLDSRRTHSPMGTRMRSSHPASRQGESGP